MASQASIPAVSVVMPVRGVAQFIRPALESIATQSSVGCEIICIDDGASECTRGEIEKLAAADPRVRLVSNSGSGIVDALNSGLGVARGHLVARMDADDVALPGRLAIQAAYLEQHQEIGVLGTQALLIDAGGKVLRKLRVPVGSERVCAALRISCALIHPTVMMRRRVVLDAGGYRRGFDGAEDYELWLRLQSSTKIDNLAQALLLYRQHEGQVTLRRQFRQARLVALAMVAERLRRASGQDVLAAGYDLKSWRPLFASIDATAFHDVLSLTACSLADNGGTLRASGRRYFRRACQAAAGRGSPEVRRRLALACVRNQVQLARNGRWRDAAHDFPQDLLQWREKLLLAYVLHASSVWRSRPPSRGSKAY